MMMSPQVFIEEFKDKSVEYCIEARDNLINELKRFETEPDYSSDKFPSPLTQYLVYVDYLKELSDVIAQKIRMNDPSHE
ncbi:MAG: hypothetical protein IJI66_11865 [Erysipelotrichaceae bacterium]|nr:hypothetical protein [Erysipelotrichaceae bacterium]